MRLVKSPVPPEHPIPAPVGVQPIEPPATKVTTPDGRVLVPTSVNDWPVDATTPDSRSRTGAVTLAEAGLNTHEYARFTNVGESGEPWQVVGTPRRDAAVALTGSFRDAVDAAQAIADKDTPGGLSGRNSAHGAWAIIGGSGDARYAVELRGYLRPDKLLGEDNVKEVFVTAARPEVEAIVSKKHWIDLREDAPDAVHEPKRLVDLPFVGPVT